MPKYFKILKMKISFETLFLPKHVPKKTFQTKKIANESKYCLFCVIHLTTAQGL